MRPSAAWQKILATAATTITTNTNTATSPNIKELFGPSLSPDAAIYLASEPNYTAHVTQRWSTHDAPSYIATIQPASVEDVRNIVKIAASHGISFLATGGGHGVSNHLANLQGGLQIDLRKFNHVAFDRDTRRLTIGGAVKFAQLIEPVFEAGCQFPLGTAYCVGVVGATLGAGVSANQGYAGLLVDLLQEVEMVTASGKVVTASREHNEDLFWALRGAGANFGIVTKAVYEVPNAVNNGNVTNANYLFPGNRAAEVFRYLSSFDDSMPGRLALNIGTLYNQEFSQLVLLINANFAGPRGEAAGYLDLLEELDPLRSEVLNVRWPDVFSTSYFGIEDTKACGRNQHVNMRSIGAKHTDIDALVNFLGELEVFTKKYPNISTAMMIHRFSTEKVLQAPDSESAYPYRKLNMHM
ncbi:hypothetical protein F4680DRAFT_401248 [Xylaria scruposa]|nr:hypothetical protein F4680DRAFT_401248 [Xylaria scruposa]